MAPMEHEGPQTTPQSPLAIMSLPRNLRFSWTFSTAGPRHFTICNDFVRLIFFLGVLRKEIPIEERCKPLAIPSKLGCKEVCVGDSRAHCKKSKLSPTYRIELGNNYDLSQWLPEAYANVFVRGDHLTTEEGETSGLEIMVKILEGRDRCKRNCWSHSGDIDVVWLVEEIFPSLNQPVAPLPGRDLVTGLSAGESDIFKPLHVGWCHPNLFIFKESTSAQAVG